MKEKHRERTDQVKILGRYCGTLVHMAWVGTINAEQYSGVEAICIAILKIVFRASLFKDDAKLRKHSYRC